jgi:hypothetical protein
MWFRCMQVRLFRRRTKLMHAADTYLAGQQNAKSIVVLGPEESVAELPEREGWAVLQQAGAGNQ